MSDYAPQPSEWFRITAMLNRGKTIMIDSYVMNALGCTGYVTDVIPATGKSHGSVTVFYNTMLPESMEQIERYNHSDWDQLLRILDDPAPRNVRIDDMRQAVADYIGSEGCSCCQGSNHTKHLRRIAKLLEIEMTEEDGANVFAQYRSPEKTPDA